MGDTSRIHIPQSKPEKEAETLKLAAYDAESGMRRTTDVYAWRPW
jgi:hypothetical protein